jgi:CBS domain-containing protein
MDEIVRFLVEHPPWRDLPAERVEGVAARLQIEYFPRGARLLSGGGRPEDGLVVIRSGSVDLVRKGRGGDELLDRLDEGDVLASDPRVARRAPDIEAVAREDTLAYLITREHLQPLMSEPSVQRFLAGTPGERVRVARVADPSRPGADLAATAVGDLVTRPVLGCGPDTPVCEAARRMRDAGVGSLLVLADPPGIVTDRDLRDRVLAVGGDLMGPVGGIRSTPLITVPADAPLMDALALMVDRGVRHLPVVREGAVVGVVTDTDLLRLQSRSPLLLRRVLERAGTPEATADWVGMVGASMEALVADDVQASAVGRVTSLAADVLVRRLIDRATVRLGPAPAAWAWLATGAEGRCEAAWPVSRAGFVLWDEGASRASVAWCASLAAEVTAGLAAAGLRPPRDAPSPADPGGLGPASSGLLAAVAAGDPVLLPALLDARRVAGPLDPGPFLNALSEAARRSGAVERMAADAFAVPPRGFFQGVVLERDGTADAHLDLDLRCLRPLVTMARVVAVRGGVSATSTPGRLADAGRRDVIPPVLARDLAAAWEFLAGLRLRLGRPSPALGGGVILPDCLVPAERRLMKDVFAVIQEGLEFVGAPVASGRAPWTA